MDEQKKYASLIIPPCDAPVAKESVPTEKSNTVGKATFSGASFAEIEIESSTNHTSTAENALRFFSSVTPPAPISQKAHDPLRLRFFDMRRLATDRPFARDDSELFYRQAKFMEDFTDDYVGDTRLLMYYPHYQHMGYEQLRTYFTWRTKVRNGQRPPTSVSYIFLYVYELLNNIGVSDPVDGLDKLLSIWDTCLRYAPGLENYMPEWFKDYHIYYDLPHSFADFVKTRNMHKYYSVSFLFDAGAENSLELWSSISSYNIGKSQFFNDGNDQIFKDCFNAVLDGIRELCESSDTCLEDLFIYSISKRMPWRPFKHSLFHHWLQQDDRNVEMPGQERYYCKNNLWTTNLPMYYSTQKEFVGYIIKKTETCLRQAVKYRYKLKADPDIRYNEYFQELRELDGRRAGLDRAIEKAVADYHWGATRTIVTVDHENLARIRREAQGTQEKLIVQDDARGQGGIRNSEFGIQNEDENDLQGAFPSYSSEPYEKQDKVALHGIEEEMESESFWQQPEEIPGAIGDEDGWGAFGEALSALELDALALVMHDGDVKAFADINGIMLEVLADGINEKAADLIGDSILDTDDVITIYDEYRENIDELLGSIDK